MWTTLGCPQSLCGVSSAGGTPNYNYELSGQALTNVYNSPVFLAERMKRPLDGASVMPGIFSHSGVRVTLRDGSRYLIHKGNKFGISSQTVVVGANHMSNKWKVVTTHNFQGTKTVSEFVADGGSDYNLIFANCHHASRAMMRP